MLGSLTRRFQPPSPLTQRLWTDDYANVLAILN